VTLPVNGEQTSWEQAVHWLRSQPKMRDLVLASYYDDPLLAAATRYWQSEEWLAIRSWLPAATGRALDVGAGRGIASFALAKDGYSVVALEPDPSPLVGAAAIASMRSDTGLPIEICQQYSESLPFPDGQFDLVFARAALHHITDLASAVREFHRVLKRGGRMIVVREHVISKPGDLQVFLTRHPLHSRYGGENALLLEGYLDAIRDAGFTITRVIAPFDSVVNTAPHNQESLQREIARRLGLKIPAVSTCIAAALLRVPGAWPLTRALMSMTDNRPGRLYSFIAVRAAD
jgi:SAM-dependent methyltransferase